MPVPAILGILAGLAAGIGTGVAQKKAQDTENERQLSVAALSQLVQVGAPVPQALVKATKLSPEVIQALSFAGQAAREHKQANFDRALKMFNAGGTVSQPQADSAVLTPPPSPAEMVRGDITDDTQVLQAPLAGTAVPQAPPAVRPSPGRSMAFDLGEGVKGTLTQPGTSEADAARVNMEAARQPGALTLQEQQVAKGRREEEAYLTKTAKERKQEMAAAKVRDLLTQAAEVPDAKGKVKFYEQAFAVALGEQLPVAKDIQDQLGRLTGRVDTRLDLSKPDVAEFVASNGVNPTTGEPVTPAERKQAQGFVEAQTQRKLDQAKAVAQASAAIQTVEAPKRLAVSGSIKTLIKEGDNVAKVKQTADQINAALGIIEKNIDAFPTVPIVGSLRAMSAEFFQTERGRKIKDIAQALQTLQTLEARRIAGEVGRIPNQVEQQWRAVNPDPRRVTKATAQSLIANSRKLMQPLGRTIASTVEKNAKAARGVGVPDTIVSAFTKGDLDVLRSAFGEGLQSGSLPPALSLEDLK